MIRLLGAAVALLILGVGCAGGGYYQTPSSEEYEPYITDVPPSYYDNDPTLRHWYTPPYWDPSSKGE